MAASTPDRWAILIPLDRDADTPLQAQLRAGLIRAISSRALPPGLRLPSTRELAQRLQIARNTVILAFRELVDDGWLEAQSRSGHRVSLRQGPGAQPVGWRRESSGTGPVQLARRLSSRAALMGQVIKPRDALAYPYPFVYGEFDPSVFPLRAWRDASRLALRPQAIRRWASDRIDADDPELIEQITQRLLPRRGIQADASQVLVTLGAQQATALVAAATTHSVVGLESPGYPEAWKVWSPFGAKTRAPPLDGP